MRRIGRSKFVAIISKLSEEQVDRLSDIAMAYLSLNNQLEGVIEANEAYVLESQKGVPLTTRKPGKHGETATKRGLSDEHLCVCVAADRERRIVVRCVNRGNPSAEDIEEALSARLNKSGVFLCDGKRAYNKLVRP